jgi:hypothetical protein
MGTNYAVAVFACAIALSLLADGIAFGQAGSTGGTIGKTDKSASGQDSSAVRSNSRPHRQQPDGSCRRIAGTWSWVWGTETVFQANGTGRNSSGDENKWHCADGLVVATWNSGYIDRITIAHDGNSLLITNNRGATFAATRK